MHTKQEREQKVTNTSKKNLYKNGSAAAADLRDGDDREHVHGSSKGPHRAPGEERSTEDRRQRSICASWYAEEGTGQETTDERGENETRGGEAAQSGRERGGQAGAGEAEGRLGCGEAAQSGRERGS